ncbi:tetratricopeptide repeat protein [soil metagenome]
MFRIFRYLCIAAVFFPALASSQPLKDSVKNKRVAQEFFIEGKTFELQTRFLDALENYKTALKYDNAAGINFAIASLYLNLSKPDDALPYMKKAILIEPKNVSYFEKLALIYISKKDFQKAAETYEGILAIDSNYTYGLYTLARLYQELNMPTRSIIYYEKITDYYGYDFDVLKKMFDIYLKSNDSLKAMGVVEALHKLDPYNKEITKILASYYESFNRTEEAEAIYEELALLDPKDKSLQTQLVKVYFLKNDIDKGFEKFRKMIGKDTLEYLEKVQVGELYYKLIQTDPTAFTISENIFGNLRDNYPNEWIPYYYLGAIDVLKNKTGYEDVFNKAIQLADTTTEVYVNIGITYYNLRSYDNAMKVLNEGIGKNNNDYRLHYFRGLSLQRMGKEAEASESLERAVEINPNDVNLFVTLAGSYNSLKKYDKSDAAYESALSIDPDNELALNNYAYNLSERGANLPKALEMSKRSLSKNPSSSSFFDTIGWIYFKMGKYEDAKENILKSVKINSKSSVVLEHLGDIYSALKDKDNAVNYWKRALDLDPNNEALKNKVRS